MLRDPGDGLSSAQHAGDESGADQSDEQAQDHLRGERFIEDEPSPENPEKGDQPSAFEQHAKAFLPFPEIG